MIFEQLLALPEVPVALRGLRQEPAGRPGPVRVEASADRADRDLGGHQQGQRDHESEPGALGLDQRGGPHRGRDARHDRDRIDEPVPGPEVADREHARKGGIERRSEEGARHRQDGPQRVQEHDPLRERETSGLRDADRPVGMGVEDGDHEEDGEDAHRVDRQHGLTAVEPIGDRSREERGSERRDGRGQAEQREGEGRVLPARVHREGDRDGPDEHDQHPRGRGEGEGAPEEQGPEGGHPE